MHSIELLYSVCANNQGSHLAKNTGKEYEKFVAELQQALLNADVIMNGSNIAVEINKIITDGCGVDRQFDIYWEYELGGITYKTVIECKDYKSKVSVDKIDAFIGKVRDIPDLKPVFATKTGYQSGAELKAEKNKIDLLIVREQNDSDWTAEDGTALVKKIRINVNVCMPARIHKFEPMIDAQWLKENTSIDVEQSISFSGQNDQIFIEHEGDKFSLYDLASRLKPLDGKEYGVFEKIENYDNAFIIHKNITLKIFGYRVEYSISKPITEVIEIDGSKELIGVIEYLQKGTKKNIFKDGVIRQNNIKCH